MTIAEVDGVNRPHQHVTWIEHTAHGPRSHIILPFPALPEACLWSMTRKCRYTLFILGLATLASASHFMSDWQLIRIVTKYSFRAIFWGAQCHSNSRVPIAWIKKPSGFLFFTFISVNYPAITSFSLLFTDLLVSTAPHLKQKHENSWAIQVDILSKCKLSLTYFKRSPISK